MLLLSIMLYVDDIPIIHVNYYYDLILLYYYYSSRLLDADDSYYFMSLFMPYSSVCKYFLN